MKGFFLYSLTAGKVANRKENVEKDVGGLEPDVENVEKLKAEASAKTKAKVGLLFMFQIFGNNMSGCKNTRKLCKQDTKTNSNVVFFCFFSFLACFRLSIVEFCCCESI